MLQHTDGLRIGAIVSMKQGFEHFVYRELQVFDAEGATIDLFPTKYRPGLYDARSSWALHRWHPVAVILWQPIMFLRAPGQYLRLLREAIRFGAVVDFCLAWYWTRWMRDVDVIYATFGDRKLYAGYFGKQILGKPLAVTIHAYELYQNPNPRLFPRALAACDQIITVTEYNREVLASTYGIEPERVDVVRISVDIEDYQPSQPFVVLIVASFAERKGHEVLFDAIKKLGLDDIEVWVVGDEGTEQSVDVREQARRAGVTTQVAFFGKLGGNALKAVYRACDVFCLPCRFDRSGVAEGFPTVLAEAMAFGKPVITTRHVEIPRIVDEIVVDENDADGLAQAIRDVYESVPLRERLGQKNRTRATELFSTANAAQTVALLRRMAKPGDRSEENPTPSPAPAHGEPHPGVGRAAP